MAEILDETNALPPVSPDDPCGPDLDITGDRKFLDYIAVTEGRLPASYFKFEQKSIDFSAAEAEGVALLARSHDVRVLVLLAKLAILNRDLRSFARWFDATARLLAGHWDEAHPRVENGDFAVRLAQLSTLADLPVVLLPLQHAPLAETQREGTLTFRAHLVALGEASPRENERTLDAATIDRILQISDLAALGRTFAALKTIKAAIVEIQATTLEKTGPERAVTFEALEPLVERMSAFIQSALAKRDPNVAPPVAHAASEVEEEQGLALETVTAAFASVAEADAALASALAYFAKYEPSSAAVLLIGQARQLLGKNLYEVMKILAPKQADAARIFVGAEQSFMIPVSGIAPRPEGDDARAPSDPEPAGSRIAALSLIDSVSAYLRKAQPSSPVPFLLDRAKSLTSRDFLNLLKDLLSEDALAQMRKGD
jgi:type VI secretion system protein ImpA